MLSVALAGALSRLGMIIWASDHSRDRSVLLRRAISVLPGPTLPSTHASGTHNQGAFHLSHRYCRAQRSYWFLWGCGLSPHARTRNSVGSQTVRGLNTKTILFKRLKAMDVAQHFELLQRHPVRAKATCAALRIRPVAGGCTPVASKPSSCRPVSGTSAGSSA